MMDSQRMENWQAGKTLTESVKFLFENELLCDVTINVVAEQPLKIKAHQFILIARSSVFEAMLNGNFVESHTKEITVHDVDPELFKDMLRYMYCDRVDITINNVLGLRNLAKMYMLDNLEELCSDFVSNEMSYDINRDNIVSMLNQAVGLHQEDAVQECLRYCAFNLDENFLQSNNLLQISYDALLLLVKYDALEGQYEHQLLAACIRWAQHQEKVFNSSKSPRNILGDILYNIRFREMTFDEFVNANDSDGTLLSKKQLLAILSDIGKHNQETGERLSEMGFNVVYRIGTVTKPTHKDWRTPLDAKYTYHGTEVLKIVTTKPVLLHAAGILQPFDDTGHTNEHNMTVTVSGGGEYRELISNYVVSSVSAPMQPWLVFSNLTIRLDPGVEYTMECSAPDDRSVLYYSTSGFERKGHDTSYITITTQQYPAVLKSKRYHEKWNLSYLHTLGVQPLDMVDIKDNPES